MKRIHAGIHNANIERYLQFFKYNAISAILMIPKEYVI
jgi:hypothetical protein